AKSLVDYIFRWMGSRFLSDDDKSGLGLIDRGSSVEASAVSSPSAPIGLAAPAGDSPAGRTPAEADLADASPSAPAGDQPKASAVATPQDVAPVTELAAPRVELGYLATVGTSNGHSNGHANGHTNGSAKPANGGGITLNLGGTKVAFATQADA